MANNLIKFVVPLVALAAVGVKLWLIPAVAPPTAPELAELAAAYAYANRAPLARQFYDRALALDPADFRANYGLGLLNYYEKRVPEAEEHLKKAIAAKPLAAEPKLTLGAIYSEQFHYGQAFKLFTEVKAQHPNNFKAEFNLGLIEANMGHFQLAKDRLYAYLKKAPSTDPDRYRSTILLKQLDQRLDAIKKRESKSK